MKLLQVKLLLSKSLYSLCSNLLKSSQNNLQSLTLLITTEFIIWDQDGRIHQLSIKNIHSSMAISIMTNKLIIAIIFSQQFFQLQKESMSQNQFYRNEVYYRAFEGMNPTIEKEEELEFDSKFESGNLDCVVKVGDFQYDIFLRIDSNTKGHLFWFYFEVKNGKKGNKIKFNICNLTKSKTLYEKGFKPYTCEKSQKGEFQNWTQEKIHNLKVQQKKLRYSFIYEKIKVRNLYELSFQYKITSSKPVRFAYCIPYTYTNLLKQINSLGQNAEVGWLGKSLTGIDIPLIKIGNFQEQIDKPVLFIMGRIHPGQSNGSIVLSGLMKYLCLSPDAAYLRKKVIILIVPMINPDGVILGNSRTGAAGKDLNREFKTKNKNLFPEVDLIKRLVWKIQETHDIEVFLDFHGHSRRKNMFFFGPNYNLTQPEYYKSRIIPKYLANLTNVFRYFGCNYTIPSCKSTTARAIMLNEIGIPFVYTIQTSVGLYYDYDSHKDLPFTENKWKQIGISICKALRQYFESIEQYQDYLKSRTLEQELSKKANKTEKIIDKGEKSRTFNNEKTKKLQSKDIKLFKLYEEIKAQENKFSKKKDQLSEADSDSQNDEDNLEKMKMAEFQGMVTQCIEVEIKRKQKTDELLGRKKQKSPPSLPKKLQRKKKKISQKEEMMLMNEVSISEKQSLKPVKNDEVFVIREDRKRKTKSIDIQIGKKQQEQNEGNAIQKRDNSNKKCLKFEYDTFLSKNQFFDASNNEGNEHSIKKSHNLKMFNFSKMVNSHPRNSLTSGRYRRQIAKSEKKATIGYPTLEADPVELKTVDKKYFNMSLEENLEKIDEDQNEFEKRQERSKGKGVFPAPFYRIKYQNYQKKKLRSLEQHSVREEAESVQIIQPKVNSSKKRKNEIFFLKIKKFQS